MQVSSGYVTASVGAIAFVVLYPLVLLVLVRRRLRVGVRYAAYGALVFLLFQIVTRIPLVELAQQALGPGLERSRAPLIGWLVVVTASASLFEETGRYVAFRWLLRREANLCGRGWWARAVMYGIGHGGLESIGIGGLALASLLGLLALSDAGLDALPVEQRAMAAEQLARISAAPAWLPLLSAWERLWVLPIQVALSVLVLQVFRRGALRWLWLAMLAHTLVNLLAVGALQLLGPQRLAVQVGVALLVAGFGLAALWITWRLRDPGPKPDVSPRAGADLS
ncbi:MAG TPA: YhfC family glutamic-type intramembrane protease [Actinophytocola sp.]|nr:YhfC family glutamic-type intramembrane protease [Actinophytocola sp.]